MSFQRLIFFALACALVVSSGFAQVFPSQVAPGQLGAAPYRSTGVVHSEIGNTGYRGSGVVARDPRLLYTCAHVIYSNGRWANLVEFARAYHGHLEPEQFKLQRARGQFYFSSYSGGDHSADFHLDFAVAYAPQGQQFGPAVGRFVDARNAIASANTNKMIVGYPATIDWNRRRGGYFQHQTGPFRTALGREHGNYFSAWGISTGSGNSGGPLFIQREGRWDLAGILVSGSRNSIGVYALNPSAETIATRALNAAGNTFPPAPSPTPTPRPTPRPRPAPTPVSNPPTAPAPGSLIPTVVHNFQSQWLPDGTRRFTPKFLQVARAPRSIETVHVDIELLTTYAGDIDIVLRSPRGRPVWLHRADPGNDSRDVIIRNRNLSHIFSGTNPNGWWRLFLRDFFREDRAFYQGATLTITSR